MKLIVGLGNPGEKYKYTRHNIGFRVVEEFAGRHSGSLRKRIFCRAREARVVFSGKKVLLVEPLTFMNLSGNCVSNYIKKAKIPLEGIMVIYDDVSLPVGTIRIRAQGSAGGHNGVESVIARLGTDVFPRLRVGIGNGKMPCGLSEYVLSDFKKSELLHVENSVRLAADACECWLAEGIDKAMGIFNSV